MTLSELAKQIEDVFGGESNTRTIEIIQYIHALVRLEEATEEPKKERRCIDCSDYSTPGASQCFCKVFGETVDHDFTCNLWSPREIPTPAIDPKGAPGAAKDPLHLLPPSFLRATAKVLVLGGRKYGPWNWRNTTATLECQTYVAAIMRHIAAYQDGEDTDPESGESHISHIAASCAIMIDANRQGTLHDNRPPKQGGGK